MSNAIANMSQSDLYKAAALAEGYESVPVDIETFINDPQYMGQIYGGYVYPYWMERLKKLYPNPFYSPYIEVCLSGDTEVDLLDGSTKTMGQICSEYAGKDFWVLGFNVNTKEWEPCRAHSPAVTGYRTVYKVTLDNGKWFKATAEHPVLGKDNRWYRVDELKVGQSLMPYNVTYDRNGYAHVWDNRSQKKVKRCRLVQQWKNPIPDSYHVHHKNINKINDCPYNLIPLSKEAHFKYHHNVWHRSKTDPELKQFLDEKFKNTHSLGGKAAWKAKTPEALANMRNAQKQWVNSEEGKKASANKFLEYNDTHQDVLKERLVIATATRWADENQRLAASKKMSARNNSAEFQKKAHASRWGSQEQHDLSAQRMSVRNSDPERQIKCHQGKILKNLNRREDLDTLRPEHLNKQRWTAIARNFDCMENGEPSFVLLQKNWDSIIERARNYNHCIVSIEEMPPEPVYNFTVDRLHNYPLACGTIVKNCVSGAIGIGKSSVSIIGILYDLYRITLLKNPHKKWKLIPTTHIVFTLITATMDLAGVVLADQLIDAISASPYFCSKLLPGKGDKIDEDMFPHRVGIAYGSRMRHSLGKAVIGAIIDEANFQDAVADQALQNYNSIRRRMFSRFMTKGGDVPCRLWVASSRNDAASFLESHIDAERGNPKVAIFEPAIWEVQKHKGIYSGKTFPVFIGSDVEQPKIITSDKEMDDYTGRTIQVPVEYRKDFENNLPGALQDLAGVATRNGVNLIYNVEALDRSMCLDNCMKSDELHLTLDGDDQIADFYKGNLPPGKYYVHLDGGLKSDRFGFAMTRVTEHISVDVTSAVDGAKTSRISPSVETPLVFGIKALPGSEVPFWKVRQFLVYLRSQKVSIALVTCDGYQSADMMQLLIKLGFNAKYASVDRTKDPYLKLSSNILLGLIKMPKSPILRNELMNLQNLPKKIDHPATIMVDGKQVAGGKDIADAVAASSYEAIGASMTLGASSLINMQKSAPVHMNMRERQEFVMERFLKMPVRR